MGTNNGQLIVDDGALDSGLPQARTAPSAVALELGAGTAYRVASSSRPEVRAGDVVIRY